MILLALAIVAHCASGAHWHSQNGDNFRKCDVKTHSRICVGLVNGSSAADLKLFSDDSFHEHAGVSLTLGRRVSQILESGMNYTIRIDNNSFNVTKVLKTRRDPNKAANQYASEQDMRANKLGKGGFAEVIIQFLNEMSSFLIFCQTFLIVATRAVFTNGLLLPKGFPLVLKVIKDKYRASRSLWGEYEALRKLAVHPEFITTFGHGIITTLGDHNEYEYILLEYGAGGDLWDWMQKKSLVISDRDLFVSNCPESNRFHVS
jgi:hypothetical protein